MRDSKYESPSLGVRVVTVTLIDGSIWCYAYATFVKAVNP